MSSNARQFLFLLLFFFSSRRRHTRYWRDWSSDVCSSDLGDAGVSVLFVIPLEELLTEGAAVLYAAEAVRKLRAVLHGSELAFRIRVVVGNIRSAVALGDAQVGHQKGDRLGFHDPAAVGVNGELAGGDLVLADGFLDEFLGQFS